jgi:hypothetical protein
VIHGFQHANVNDLHEKMCHRLMFGSRFGKDYDWVHGTEVGLHNVTLAAKSFSWDFDLKRLWIPPSRWTMMVRQYLNMADVDAWLDLICDRMASANGRGIAVLRTNTVQGRGTGKSVRRRFGSCMLNFSFRRNPYPQISLHSRTTYFGYLAALDITVAYTLANMIAEEISVEPEEMAFVWTIELAQFHGFRSLAWPLMNPYIREQMIIDLPQRLKMKKTVDNFRPGYRKALDGFSRIHKADEIHKLYGDEAFSSFNRVRRRYHTEAFGEEYSWQFSGGARNVNPFKPLPSTPVSTLDIVIPLQGKAETIYDDEPDDDENE